MNLNGSFWSVVSSLGPGDPRVTIAVLDGPVDRSHPCFRGANLQTLQAVVNPQPQVGGATSHGTHVASVIFGQPDSPLCGIAPMCRGLIVPVFGDDRLSCTQLDLARAILLALENGAQVINISGGQPARSEQAEPVLDQVIARCAERNVLIVAAAGNDGCECFHIPAGMTSVLAVGAMDENGDPTPSSNWGAVYRSHGIMAPGANISGADLDGQIVARTGTSFATALISGFAGLMVGLQIRNGMPPNAASVGRAILKTAAPCSPWDTEHCRRFLGGRIDPMRAAALIAGGEVNMDQAETISFGAAIDEVEASVRMAEGPPVMSNDAPQISPSDCGCGCGGNSGECNCGKGESVVEKPSLVYALGKLGYDFGTEARRDSFIQAMPHGANNPVLPEQLLEFLIVNPYEAASIIWTLNVDVTPIYAIQPAGPFGAVGYQRLLDLLRGQVNEGVEMVSVPGVIGGSVRLQSGQVLPVIVPAIRGMFSWAPPVLVSHVLGARPKGSEAQERYDALASGLGNFLNRIYYDLRNLGITGEERALNYSATNAVQIADVIRVTTQQHLDLDTIEVKKSPICRLDSECYDVEVSFFNPNNTNIASRVFRFAIDVSDVVPVTVGAVRSWTRRV